MKGLDYALLRKNRENSELLSSQFLPLAQTNPSSKNDLTIDSSEISKKKSIQIETLMGINIYQILELNTRKLSNNTGLPASQIASSSTTAGHGAPNTKSAIKLNPITTRLTVGSRGYEFDLRPSSNDDMPTEVSRSKLVRSDWFLIDINAVQTSADSIHTQISSFSHNFPSLFPLK